MTTVPAAAATRLPSIPIIPLKAQPAWEALTRTLNRTDAVIPCTSVAREWWTSEDRGERETAAIACDGCTALRICGTYADLADIRWHVYGGRDRQTKSHNGMEKMK